MIKYCRERWNKNQQTLRKKLEEDIVSLSTCDYKYLVTLTVKYILGDEWDAENITEVNNGGYMGTLLYLIPRKVYFYPSENEYLMTFCWYGSSCSERLGEGFVCEDYDILSELQQYGTEYVRFTTCPINLTGKTNPINCYMSICKYIVANMIQPYNKNKRHTYNKKKRHK